MQPFTTTPWTVDPPIYGKGGRKAGEKPNISHDVSGIAAIETTGFPRHGLVIDDERRSAQRVIIIDGAIHGGPDIKLIDGEDSLDGEGVAYGGGFFYVVGSHGHPRDPKVKLNSEDDVPAIDRKIAAASHLLEIAVPVDAFDDPDTTSMTVTRDLSLRATLKSFHEIKPYLDKRLDQNGVSIEGLAVRDGLIYAGLRSPILTGAERGRPDAADDHFAGVIIAGLADPSKSARIAWLPLGAGRGIRDLAPYGDGLLVLAGPSRDIPATLDVPDGAYALYFWRLSDETPMKLGPIPGGRDAGTGEAVKPEAILPLGLVDGALQVLVLFDHAASGGPRPFLFSNPDPAIAPD